MQHAELVKVFTSARAEITSHLPSPNTLTVKTSRVIIACYTAAIAPNFVAWMAAAALSARSLEARFACEENLHAEIVYNHPGMLERFAVAVHALPSREHAQTVHHVVAETRAHVAHMNGLYNVAFIATLEHASSVFIPWLAKLATLSGSSELTYTNTHGKADKAHAEQFLWALEHETRMHDDASVQIAKAVKHAVTFLKNILQNNKTGHA